MPGPGAYTHQSKCGQEGKANSMHCKLEYKPIEKTGGFTPGPGSYEFNANNKKKEPVWGTGTEKRAEMAKTGMVVPAPNAYKPSLSMTQKNEARWVFGSEQRKGPVEKSSIAPGPGNYALEPMAFDHKKPRFHVGQKIAPLKGNTTVPGAGAYNPIPENTISKQPIYSMK